ncbi:DUF4181 domain-containing protein [Ornithinibacillus sp. BX22]|uniref:DUF4181 domain-containing protein n=1 Tax=Ornithinibacillus hominis TaxID=2763055 RepID=A0A923L6G6_9BACI|nr:DUF4181 domain-containing protein [Ornithinibacillus hominis]MBC5637363.1 DUF4181 domain-containing protein [Ornithinibacillus hominis]
MLLNLSSVNYLQYHLIGGGYQPINNTHKWGRRIFSLLFVLSIFAFIFEIGYGFIYIIIGSLFALSIFEACMEWIYEPEKQYIISIIESSAFAVMFIGILIISLQTLTFEEALKEYGYIDIDSVEKIEVQNVAWNEEEKELWNKTTVKREVMIDDPKLIREIFHELHELKYRERPIHHENRDNYYRLSIKGKSNFDITVYDKCIAFYLADYQSYRILDENSMYEFLEEMELGWE